MSGPYGFDHSDCSFTCGSCGGKVLLESACKPCYRECDYDEVVKSVPEDELCKECRETCPNCNGSGGGIERFACRSCGGTGKKKRHDESRDA